MKRFSICAVLLLFVGGIWLFGYHPQDQIHRLVKNESLANQLSMRIQEIKKDRDRVSFLILSGQQSQGDIVILYSSERFIDPEYNIGLSERFLNYYRRGSVDLGGYRVALAYIAADTIPDMSHLFDERALTDPFPKDQQLEEFCGIKSDLPDYTLFLVKEGQIIRIEDNNNLANNYPLDIEYYVDDDDLFLRLSSSTKTYELFDGIKESIGSFIQVNDTLKLIPTYSHYTSSLLQRPVIVNVEPDSTALCEQSFIVQARGKNGYCLKYFPSSFDDYHILLRRIHKNGMDSTKSDDDVFIEK